MGVPASSGSSSSALRVGGRTAACMALRTFSSPAPPAAVIRWPRLDLAEPMGRSVLAAKMLAMLATSVASPKVVPVAWHSSRPIVAGSRPAAA